MVVITKTGDFHTKKVRTAQHWFLPLLGGGGGVDIQKFKILKPDIKSDITMISSCPLDLKVMRLGHIVDISANSPCLWASFHP
jgi:hypothetical protein